AELVLGLARVEAVGDVVLLRRRQLLGALARAVMVGDDQARRRHEARRAVRRARRRLAHVLEPGGIGGKAVRGLDLVRREAIEGPHALIGEGQGGGEDGEEGYQAHGGEMVQCRREGDMKSSGVILLLASAATAAAQTPDLERRPTFLAGLNLDFEDAT